MNYENQEREISLKDMLFSAMYHWKKMLLAALILAVALGGFMGYKSWKDATNPELVAKYEQEYADAMILYEDEKTRLERELGDIEENIENQEEYLENSLVMKMDPHNVYEARASLYISTDYQILPEMSYQNTDKTQLILAFYQAALTNGEVMGEIAENAGVKVKYLREVVSVTSQMDHILDITVRHAEQEEAEKIMDQLLNNMAQIQVQLTESIEAHQVSTVFTSVSSDVDSNLAATQKAEKNMLQELKETLEVKQEELDELKEPTQTALTTTGAIKDGIKWAILGAFAGIFAVAVVACVAFIVSDKVYSGDELKNRFGLKILGSVAAEKKFSRLDSWLRGKEGRATANSDAGYDLIAMNVKNYGGEMKTLLVTGDGNEQLINRLVGVLQPKLPQVKLLCCGSLLQDAKAVQSLPECDGVLLVEKCGASRYSNIARTVERVKDAQKQLVGCIIEEI